MGRTKSRLDPAVVVDPTRPEAAPRPATASRSATATHPLNSADSGVHRTDQGVHPKIDPAVDPLVPTPPVENPQRVNPTPSHLANASSEQIKREIDSTRSKMDQTLAELEAKLQPASLLDTTISFFRNHESGRLLTASTGQRLVNTAEDASEKMKQHPITTALFGAGLAYYVYRQTKSAMPWLTGSDAAPPAYPEDAFSSVAEDRFVEPISADDFPNNPNQPHPIMNNPSNHSNRNDHTSTGHADGGFPQPGMGREQVVGRSGQNDAIDEPGLIASATERVNEFVATAGDAITGVTRSAYLRTRATARDLTGTDHAETHRPGQRRVGLVDTAGEKYSQASNEYPLAVGLGFLALGALAGLIAPRTRREDEWMGQQSDQLKSGVRTAASQATATASQQGRQALADIGQTASQVAAARGLTKEGLLERLQSIARDSGESLSQVAQREGLTPHSLLDDLKDVVFATKQAATQHAEQAGHQLESTAHGLVGQVAGKLDDAAAAVDGKYVDAKATVTDKASQAKQTAESKLAEAKSAADDVLSTAKDKVDQAHQTAKKLDAAADQIKSGGSADGKVAEVDIVVATNGDMKVEAVDVDAVKVDDRWTDKQKTVS